jgi:predicted nicotinamide N-methyase
LDTRVDDLALTHETIQIGDRSLQITRPVDAESLLEEEAFEREEFLPYWAELWPAGRALAEVVGERDVAGLSVVELGCGLGLPSLVAALGGARVLATDWSPDAIELLRTNAEQNAVELEAAVVPWNAAEELLARAPFDLVLASDVLYERRNADELLELLPQLGGEVLVADPSRPFTKSFLERAAKQWTLKQRATRGSVTIWSLTDLPPAG